MRPRGRRAFATLCTSHAKTYPFDRCKGISAEVRERISFDDVGRHVGSRCADRRVAELTAKVESEFEIPLRHLSSPRSRTHELDPNADVEEILPYGLRPSFPHLAAGKLQQLCGRPA